MRSNAGIFLNFLPTSFTMFLYHFFFQILEVFCLRHLQTTPTGSHCCNHFQLYLACVLLDHSHDFITGFLFPTWFLICQTLRVFPVSNFSAICLTTNLSFYTRFSHFYFYVEIRPSLQLNKEGNILEYFTYHK